MKKKHLFVLFLASGLLAGAQAFAGDMEAAILSNTCAGCHGTDGASAGEAPVIAGLPEPYLASAMKNYADGTRYSTIMGRIAKGYDPGQILDMAKFYANLPWANANQKVDSDLAAKGQRLHMTKGCIGCHGANGISPMPTTPRLAGQYIDYLVITMQQYQDPSLAIPPTAIAMRGMLAGVGEDDLKALANFYASQK
jgi:sulfide dehydrogenase cytochrome subunit